MDFDEEASPGSGSSRDIHRSKKRRLAGACDACRKRKSMFSAVYDQQTMLRIFYYSEM